MNYVIVKQTKSKGIAFLLVVFFGPLGMFYSTIAGGLTMTLIAPVVILGFFWKALASHSYILTFLAFFWMFLAYILCFLWTMSAVKDYNSKILNESHDGGTVSIPSETKDQIYQNLERVKKLHIDGVLTDEMYEQQKNEYLHSLRIFDQSQYDANYHAEFETVFSKGNRNAYKTWIIVLFIIGLIVTWFSLWAHNNNIKQDSFLERNVEAGENIEEKMIDRSVVEKKATESKKTIIESKTYSYSLDATTSYTGQWINQDLSIDGHIYRLQLKEKDLNVTGTLDKFTIRGKVKETYEADDLLRRELIAKLYNEQGDKIALISIDLYGDYEKGKAWNETVELTVKEKYSEESILDAFKGVLFSKE